MTNLCFYYNIKTSDPTRKFYCSRRRAFIGMRTEYLGAPLMKFFEGFQGVLYIYTYIYIYSAITYERPLAYKTVFVAIIDSN